MACTLVCQIPTMSALLRATHCVPLICSTWEAIWWLSEVNIWRGCQCVKVWPLQVNVHAWIRFCTMQCGCDRCTLDSHWICIGQFGYWTGLNLDSVWTGLKYVAFARFFLVFASQVQARPCGSGTTSGARCKVAWPVACICPSVFSHHWQGLLCTAYRKWR